MTSTEQNDRKLAAGTRAYRRAATGLFLGGFMTFATLYAMQSVLPELSREFGVTPATASLAVSSTSMALAVCLVFFGSLSEAWGRKNMMAVSLFASAAIMCLTALAPGFSSLLALRLLLGVSIAGLPAIAMTYVAEEFEDLSIGVAAGILVSGNSLGGMCGRMATSMLTDAWGWRPAVGLLGAIGLAASAWFCFALPPSRHFKSRPLSITQLRGSLVANLKDPGLLCLFGIAFCLQGAFTGLYNYIGYKLTGAPYFFSQTLLGFVFLNYLTSPFATTWMGRLAPRIGPHRVLWFGFAALACGALVTTVPPVFWQIAGLTLFSSAFFGTHTVASSWVSRRARVGKAQAASLYLLFYYAGLSVGGTSAGVLWAHHGWGGVVTQVVLLLCCAFLLSLPLRRADGGAGGRIGDPVTDSCSNKV